MNICPIYRDNRLTYLISLYETKALVISLRVLLTNVTLKNYFPCACASVIIFALAYMYTSTLRLAALPVAVLLSATGCE